MNWRLPTFLAPALALAAGIALAGDVNLTAVQFPDRVSIDVPLARTSAAPAGATAEASVKFAGGQARIKVSFRSMEPAILFGGDISAYVVWAVTRDGVAENLGELIVSEPHDSRSQEYATGMKQFALMITAEPYDLVGKPSAPVLFTSMSPADARKAQSSPFAFGGFRPGPNSGLPSIAGLTYKDTKPVALKQAEKALALAEANGASAVNPQAMQDAKTAFAQATNSAKSGGSARAVTDYSRRAITLVAEAMRDVGRKRDAEAAAADAARRKAELDALAGKASSADAARVETEATLAQVEAARQALASEKAQLEKDKTQLLQNKAAIQAERDALAKRLVGSMAQIMETTESARGAVMSLPGISFEPGRATLTPSAQVTLAKLAGVLLVFPNVNTRIEGYTDSTGKPEANRKLSEARARSVCEFLKKQGVAGSRLAYQGLGHSSPVADNARKEGRAKNRRVEIVVAEGEIKSVAPQ